MTLIICLYTVLLIVEMWYIAGAVKDAQKANTDKIMEALSTTRQLAGHTKRIMVDTYTGSVVLYDDFLYVPVQGEFDTPSKYEKVSAKYMEGAFNLPKPKLKEGFADPEKMFGSDKPVRVDSTFAKSIYEWSGGGKVWIQPI